MSHRLPRLTHRLAECALAVLMLGGSVQVLADGLPGEYLITNRWRTLHVPYSPLTNPALLTEANYVDGRAAISTTLGEFYQWEFGATIPMGLYQSVGVTWLSQGTGRFPKVDSVGTTDPTVTINDNQNFFIATYAVNPWRRVSVGVNLTIAERRLFDDPMKIATAFGALPFGLDFGVTLRALRHPVLGDHIIGVSTVNLIPLKFKDEEEFSSAIQISLLSNFWERRLESCFDFNIKDFGAKAQEFKSTSATGDFIDTLASWEWDLNGRVGGWILRMFNLYGLFGLANGGFEYWGFAVGFNIPSVNMGRDLAVGYHFITLPENGQGEAKTNSWYVRGDFGMHREEIYARKMARLANITPNNLYTRALALYNQGNYWDAFYIFGRLKVEYPDFYKNDWVSYYMSSCQEEMDMRTVATDGYQKTKSEYPRSVSVPPADLGLMRIMFREGNYSGVSSQFVELNKPEVPDSLRYHAAYIMGQACFAQGDFAKAKQTLELVPETHPDYVFAQHTIGIVHNVNGEAELALAALQACIQATVTTNAQKECVNRSFVILGYLFYENASTVDNSFAKAVTALRSVPATSYYYEDALLGLGWVGLRASQWTDCIGAGDNLIKSSKKPMLQAEGGLLKAYALMMQKNFAGAVAILEEALKRLDTYSGATQDSLEREQRGYQNVRSEYDILGDMATQLALTRQSSLVLGQIDSLSSPQKSAKQKINEHNTFVDETHRAKFFERNIQTVREDVEYALARAQKMAGTKGASEMQQKTKEKTEELDTEIEKLKKEMENLEKK